jgi:hypothetical protein
MIMHKSAGFLLPFYLRSLPVTTLKENILTFAKNRKYFSIDELKNNFNDRDIPFTDESVKKYLHLFKNENKIYNAGRGWYSNIANKFVLNTEPIESLVNLIANQFPLLSFSCWSTEQIKDYFHHMQARYITYIFSETDNLPVLYNHLIQKHDNVYLNPTKWEIKKNFIIKEKTYILRPSISEEPSAEHMASIEKILIDLFLEKDRIDLISGAEFDTIFKNVITDSRINIARLLRYAKRREIRSKIKGNIH